MLEEGPIIHTIKRIIRYAEINTTIAWLIFLKLCRSTINSKVQRSEYNRKKKL